MAKRKFIKKNDSIILDRPIVLMGFMGCGKTSVANEISQLISWPYLDLDDLIVKKEGQTIPDIFKKFGEAGFRKRENNVLKEALSQSRRLILALGGGTPCIPENLQFIKEHALSIYIQASPRLLFNRLQQKRYKRPLIANLSDDELLPFIKKLLRKRRSYYMQADYRVRANTSSRDLAKRIIEQRFAHYTFS